jgi:RNA polymerase sigma-70 factor (ECF subfamily)
MSTGAERSAFDLYLSAHGGQVLRVCRAILHDEHLSHDAAQDAFLRLWKRMAAGEAPSAPGGWLRRAAVSSALDVRRRRLAGDDAEELVRTEAARHDKGYAGPEQAAARAELARRLQTALARLPEGQRTVFELRHFGGLALSDIAEMLCLALPTVKTHFARACLKLQAALSTYRDEDDR